MLTKEIVYDLYRKFSKSGTSIVVVPYREIDEEAFNSECWDAFEWHRWLFQDTVKLPVIRDDLTKNFFVKRDDNLNKLSVVIKIPYEYHNQYADAIYELNNVVGQDGCCMLFVNNMIYSFASYLVIEDDYQNYEKIKAAIEKYQLEIDMTQTLDSLYSQLYSRAYNTINFTSNCSKDQILLQMTAVYAYKDKDELARSGYYVSEADKPTVFISYSHNDKIIVKDVKDRIVMCGLNVWFDENCIAVGKHIVNEFMDGITKSDYAIIFASKSTISSVYSKAEIQNLFVKVLNNEIKLFIVKLDDVDMNSIFPNLKNYKYYDFYQEHNIDKLVMSIVDFVKKK
ncbi:MAG: toll/interleukin-1 receptor domain-containing protein [[Eubacterium] siraeum]